MKNPPRTGAPEPVERLWSTIEEYCEKKTGNRRPVRRIATRTGLSRSTISDWFNYRSFPKWEGFSQLLEYFDDEAWRTDLAIMWQAAWAAHQAHQARPAPAENQAAENQVETEPVPPRRQSRRRWVLVLGALLAVLAITGYVLARRADSDAKVARTGQGSAPTAPAVGILGGTCMAVTARDVRVFTSVSGDEPWTRWGRGTRFWVDRDAGSPHRYRTVLRNGRHGWVTTDHRYVQPATGCG
jgi:hypothetical protein